MAERRVERGRSSDGTLMGGTTKLPLEAAEIIAAAFIHHLSPYAERIEVAGSIRRK